MSETKGKHTPRCPRCNEQQLGFGLGSDLVGWLGIVRCKSGKCTGEYAFYDIEDWTDFAQFFPHKQLVAALRAYDKAVCALSDKQLIDNQPIMSAIVLGRAALRAAGEDVE